MLSLRFLHAQRPLGWTDGLAAIGLLTLVMFIYGLPVTMYLQAVPGDLGDARFNSVVLEHVYRWLTGIEPSLWSPRFYFPYEGALAFSDNHFGSILSYVLARWGGASREVAFDIWFLVGVGLNALSAYVVSRRLGLPLLAAWVSGFIFSANLPFLALDGHAQLTYRFAVPFAFAAYVALRGNPSVSSLASLIIWICIQFFCSIYLGVFLILLLVAMMAVDWRRAQTDALKAQFSRQALRHVPRRAWHICLCLLAVVLMLALGAMLYEYKSVASYYGVKRGMSEITSMLPRPGSYLLADRSPLTGWIGAWVTNVPTRHEQQMFWGVGVWVLVLAGVATLRAGGTAGWHRTMAWSLVILAVLTLCIGNFSLYKALAALPGFNSIRAVARIILVMLWPASLLAGIGAVWMMQSRMARHLGGLPVLLLVFGLGVAELAAVRLDSTPISAWQQRQQALAKQHEAPAAGAIILVYPVPQENWILSELDAMIFAQDRDLPTLNGYSGASPRYIRPMQDCMPPDLRLRQYAAFKSLSPDAMERERNRIVPFNQVACPGGVVQTRRWPIARSMAQDIELQVEKFTIQSSMFRVEIKIINKSSLPLITLSESGDSVSLGWRFLADGKTPPKWRHSTALVLDVPAGQARSVSIEGAVDQELSNAIEFSLKQEGQFWFHDVGMNTAVKRF